MSPYTTAGWCAESPSASTTACLQAFKSWPMLTELACCRRIPHSKRQQRHSLSQLRCALQQAITITITHHSSAPVR